MLQGRPVGAHNVVPIAEAAAKLSSVLAAEVEDCRKLIVSLTSAEESSQESTAAAAASLQEARVTVLRLLFACSE